MQSFHDQMTLEPKKALLISVYKNSALKGACEEHLIELALLADTYGILPLQKIPCFIRKFDASTFITSGIREKNLE